VHIAVLFRQREVAMTFSNQHRANLTGLVGDSATLTANSHQATYRGNACY